MRVVQLSLTEGLEDWMLISARAAQESQSIKLGPAASRVLLRAVHEEGVAT